MRLVYLHLQSPQSPQSSRKGYVDRQDFGTRSRNGGESTIVL